MGIEIAAHRDDMREILSPLNHALTADCTTAERSLARVLGGSCQVPLAAYATLAEDDILSLRGLVARPDGSSVLIAQASAPRRYAEQLGRAVAKLLEDDGAKELIAEVLAGQ